MKKFFTNLSKCSLAIIIAATVLISSFSASAGEYKSMIRYDRVWECYSDGHDDPDCVVKCMKFVGTEEINGKEYHKIETFRKTFPRYDQFTKTYSYDNYVDGLNQHEGYLREEDGVVYTLVICYPYEFPESDIDYGPLFIPGKNEPEDNEVIVEIPVYDFTRKQGDCYGGMSFCMQTSQPCIFTVIRDDNIEIEGETYRKICLFPDEVKENEYLYGEEVVEGIGSIEHGCLNYHELEARPTMRWAQNYFNRLLDLDGNVIYNPFPSLAFEIQYENFRIPDGVSITEHSEDTAPLYDILGRRITEAAPGQLYIQRGKKHIAK